MDLISFPLYGHKMHTFTLNHNDHSSFAGSHPLIMPALINVPILCFEMEERSH